MTDKKDLESILASEDPIKAIVERQAKLIKEAKEDEAYCEVCDISYYPDEPCRLH